MTAGVIRKLHALAQGGSTGDAGEWKQRNNEIIEILPGGERRVRFTPATAKQTPDLIDELCRSYLEAYEDARVPPLLLAATFVFDFLCIHPFRDGNGRVSRLITTLLLQSQGFQVARYVSLERLVEESKEDYYRVLGECSAGWHEGRNGILPWWNYFLGIVRSAYREFETQVTAAPARPAKGDMIRRTLLEQTGSFTLAGLSAQLPGVSPQLIKKVLGKMKAEGLVRLDGRGRGASWTLAR
jgi:Fic family protein